MGDGAEEPHGVTKPKDQTVWGGRELHPERGGKPVEVSSRGRPRLASVWLLLEPWNTGPQREEVG